MHRSNGYVSVNVNGVTLHLATCPESSCSTFDFAGFGIAISP